MKIIFSGIYKVDDGYYEIFLLFCNENVYLLCNKKYVEVWLK